MMMKGMRFRYLTYLNVGRVTYITLTQVHVPT